MTSSWTLISEVPVASIMQPSDSGYGLIDDEYFEYDSEKDFINSGSFAEVFKAVLKRDGTGKVLDPPVQVAAKVVTKPSEPRLSSRCPLRRGQS